MRINKSMRELMNQEPKNIKVEGEIPEEHEDIANIGFSIDKNGELIVHCEWDYEYQSDPFSQLIGSILKLLTTGVYDIIITQVLLESIKEDKNIDPKFVENIIKYWKEEEIQEKPIVSPLKTFGESNFGFSL